jgi:uncharacterized protein YdhG (YjbR/CyaY superfamily)
MRSSVTNGVALAKLRASAAAVTSSCARRRRASSATRSSMIGEVEVRHDRYPRRMVKPASIDAYLAGVPADRRAALEKLRAQIHAIVPDFKETISYSMPAFRWNGEVIAGFLATKDGCSYYPFSGTALAKLGEVLAAHSKTKSAVHFDPEKGLANALVKKLLAARKAEITGASQPALSAAWHASHPMPRGATTQQRIQWHLDRERHCGCRPMPLKLRARMARGVRPSREPWRRPGKPHEE